MPMYSGGGEAVEHDFRNDSDKANVSDTFFMI